MNTLVSILVCNFFENRFLLSACCRRARVTPTPSTTVSTLSRGTVGRDRGSAAARRGTRGSGRAPPPARVFPRRRKVWFASSVTRAISPSPCAPVFRFISSPRPMPLLRRFSPLLLPHSQGKNPPLLRP
jgi:hypothetical protein